jgi:hypothetical protein
MSSSILSAALTHSVFGGFVNRFRNGTMDVWQRGTAITVSAASAYTADGWIVGPGGANCTVNQAGGRLLTTHSLQIVGNTGVTGITLTQRIESSIAAPLSGQVVTVQAWVFNSTGASFAPVLFVGHSNTPDNFGSSTADVNGVALQTCANGVWTQVAYSFVASAGSANGLVVSLSLGNNFSANTKFIQITECDVRATPGLTVGLNSAPPAPELRPYPVELAFCQRYLPAWLNLASGFASGLCLGTGQLTFALALPVTARVAPSNIVVSAAANFKALTAGGALNPFTSMSLNAAQLNMIQLNGTGSSGLVAGNCGFVYGTSASDFILATGCEL